MDIVVKVSKTDADRGGNAVNTGTHKKRLTPSVEAKITGGLEARLIALACITPPDGHAKWSKRPLEKHLLLAEEIPTLDHGDSHGILGLCEKHTLGQG